MEKNGAITSETPDSSAPVNTDCAPGSCGCRNRTSKMGSFAVFPTTEADADDMDKDIVKAAADLVKAASLRGN